MPPGPGCNFSSGLQGLAAAPALPARGWLLPTPRPPGAGWASPPAELPERRRAPPAGCQA
eukprot:1427464-Heterocapsa_arctica.AAC.1